MIWKMNSELLDLTHQGVMKNLSESYQEVFSIEKVTKGQSKQEGSLNNKFENI